MNKNESHFLAHKDIQTGERQLQPRITREEFLSLLETEGIKVHFEKTEGDTLISHNLVFKSEPATDKEININIYDGAAPIPIGFVKYLFNVEHPSLAKYYFNMKNQAKYEGTGIMTAGTAILFEVAKSKGLTKIEGTTNTDNLAAIQSRLNVRDLFTNEPYETEVTQLGDTVNLTTYL